MEQYFVYIIQSEVDSTLYKGHTSDYLKRLAEHNGGLSKYTSLKRPWVLKYVEVHASKTEALQRELMLKRQNRRYLLWLLEQPSNILHSSVG